jgi:hypothetical protein
MREEFNVKEFDDFLRYITLPLTITGDPEHREPFIGLRVCYHLFYTLNSYFIRWSSQPPWTLPSLAILAILAIFLLCFTDAMKQCTTYDIMCASIRATDLKKSCTFSLLLVEYFLPSIPSKGEDKATAGLISQCGVRYLLSPVIHNTTCLMPSRRYWPNQSL